MNADRYVVLGLAHVRSDWFREVSRWATAAVIPLDFVKCVSVDELRARLSGGRSFSAVLVDAGLPGLDRDVIQQARDIGCAVIVVNDGSGHRDLTSLGVSAVLPETFNRDLLLGVLSEQASPIGPVLERSGATPTNRETAVGWRGRIVAVTGGGGTGTSVIAMALAQGLAQDVRAQGRVLLADFALNADQAMLHDARDIVPGVQELVDAFRHATPGRDEIMGLTFGTNYPYRLLLGLRRHRDWTSLRSKSFDAALDALRGAFTSVVCDVEADIEGEADCGSFDIEDRNLMARRTTELAEVVVVTALPGVQGVHGLVRHLILLSEHGIPLERVVTVINRAPKGARARAEITKTTAALLAPAVGSAIETLASPIFISEQRRLDHSLRDGVGAPAPMVTTATAALQAAFERFAGAPVIDLTVVDPVAITPGSLGSWSTTQEAAG